MQKAPSNSGHQNVSTRKKIAFISPCYPPAISGVGDYTAILKSTLEKKYDIHVFTDNAEKLRKFNNIHSPWWKQEESMWLQFDIVLFQYTPHMYFKDRKRLFDLIEMLKTKNIPVIAALHEFFMPEFGSFIKNILLKNLFRKHDVRFIKSLDEVIVTLPERARSIKKFSKSSINVIPAGSNIPRFEISKTEKEDIRNKHKADLLLGSFGNFHPDKRYETILDLLEKNTRWKWICLGGDKNIYFERLKNITVNKDLQDRAFFYTNLSGEEVSRYLQALDVFLMTDIRGMSGRKGSGLAAIANGCAVVALKTADTEDCFRHGKNILFFKEDPQETISQILNDGSLAGRIKKGALKLNRERFSWASIANHYEKIFEKHLKRQT